MALGAVLVFCASATIDTQGVHIGYVSPLRYVVLVGVGLIFIIGGGYFAIVTERREANLKRLPIDKISIKGHDTSLTPYPLVWVSGEVTPKKAGVKVWLVREDVSHRAGSFFPSTEPGITDANGQWRQSVALWKPGPFRIHAVVTTEEYSGFYHLYRSVYNVALKVCKRLDPDIDHVPDWPFFRALPADSVAVPCGPVPYPG